MPAGPGDQEAHRTDRAQQPGQRVDRQLEALLVDQAPGEEDALLARARLPVGRRPGRLDAVDDHLDPILLDAEHVDQVAAHVVRADDQPVGPVDRPALDGVDVGLGPGGDPAPVAAVLGRVDGHRQRAPEARGQAIGRPGDEPVVPVDEVEVEVAGQADPGRQQVVVQPLHPGHEPPDVAGAGRLGYPVDEDAVDHGGPRRPPGQDVDLDSPGGEPRGEPPDVAAEAALDDRRVLPAEDQASHGSSRGAIRAWTARLPGPAPGSPASARASAAAWPATRSSG